MTDTAALLSRVRTTAADHPPLKARAKLDLGPAGIILIDGTAGANAVTAEDGEAHVTLRMKPEVLGQLLDGSLDPTVGYMMGKLKVSGDMSVAMRLSSVI